MIQDSGNRTQFSTGAVREMKKGRRDLLPLRVIGNLLAIPELDLIDEFIFTGKAESLKEALYVFNRHTCMNPYHMFLDMAEHYEDALSKYPERNWERGIPLNSLVGSAVGHIIQHYAGDTDEDHGRAFVWNILAILHMMIRRDDYPGELYNLPFNQVILATEVCHDRQTASRTR